MPKTAKKKNAPSAKPDATKTKVNKSAWIRNQPASMPAKDVVAKATEAGIRLSLAQVYTARSNAKKKPSNAGVKPSKGKTANSTSARPRRVSASDEPRSDRATELAFRRLVLLVGLTRVEEMLDEIKHSLAI